MKNEITFYEVKHGHAITGKDGKFAFDTEKEAVDMVTEFKKNPRSHNAKMTDDNVKYWSTQTYTVVKKTVITEDIITI